MTSSSGAWSVEDINAWQREAGLKSRKKISLMNLPGWNLLLATKQY
jgi:hypothetical protein